MVDSCRKSCLPVLMGGPQGGVHVCRLHITEGCKALLSACNGQLLEHSLVSAGSRSMDTSRGTAPSSPAHTFTSAATTAVQSARAGTSGVQQPEAAHRPQAAEPAAALSAAEVDVIEISSGGDSQSQGSQLPGRDGPEAESGLEITNQYAGGHIADCRLETCV